MTTNGTLDPNVGTQQPLAPAIGRQLGKYLLTARLGQGTEGFVFRGLHQGLKFDVAIKVLRPTDPDDADYRRIKTEAGLLAQLNHPNIVRLFDFEDDPSQPYLVMEFVEGPNLAELIIQSGKISPDRALRILRQMISGLQAALKFGVIHRDIKPANVLMTRDGTVKLADLGTGIRLRPDGIDPASEDAGLIVGTAAYMAPEQFTSPISVDHRADIYALGITAYHMLTGRMPFDGMTLREVMVWKCHNEMPVSICPPVHQVEPSLPLELSGLIETMMARKVLDRYATYELLLSEMSHVESLISPVAAPTASLRRSLSLSYLKLHPSTVIGATNTTRTTQTGPVADPPTDAAAAAELLHKSNDAAQAGRTVEARELLIKARDLDPGNEQIWLALAGLFTSPAESKACLAEAVKRIPDSERLQSAYRWFGGRVEPQSGKRCLLCALAADKREDRCSRCGAIDHLRLPDIWFGTSPLGKPEMMAKAVAHYERMLVSNPDPRVGTILAIALLNSGRFEEALVHLREVAKARPESRSVPAQIAAIERYLEGKVHAPAGPKPVVVVIDDSATMRQLVTAKLQSCHCEIIGLPDANDAMERLPQLKPAVILLDVKMPGVDGYELCRWIRRHPDLSAVPVIFVTVADRVVDRVRARLAGATKHIAKPFDGDELMQLVDQYCPRPANSN
jgi:serine/threonine protein kinase/CheY-like chemotaxis protein